MSPSGPIEQEMPSPMLKNAISLLTMVGHEHSLSLLSLVTCNSKQETFVPTKLPRLNCETVMEEKAQEKSSLLENGTVHQGDVSCGSTGSAWQYDGRESYSSSLSEQYPCQGHI